MGDILIRGMEMPMPGRYEAVIIVLDKSAAEIAISPAEDDIGYWKEYPLVPVPSHGDLIDRDALHQELYALEYARENEWLDGIREARGVDAARVALLDAPTIIEGDEHT